jgi:hypothetical protein
MTIAQMQERALDNARVARERAQAENVNAIRRNIIEKRKAHNACTGIVLAFFAVMLVVFLLICLT